VLFATEMWERFSFYSMLAMFTLYLQNPTQGFGWTAAEATGLYANYLAFVYASPLIGGWLADKKLGYRRAVMIGGVFFMAGHLLLSFRSLPVVYAALTCLVIGNGFFKPNVSAMVGNLYPEGSHLKDHAYNIFYMGINIGAFMAPVMAEFVSQRWGFHPAFAVAALGMVISVSILWRFKTSVEHADRGRLAAAGPAGGARTASGTRTAPVTASRRTAIDEVSDGRRIGALVVIYLIVIVFWMVFHQNGSTLTYWANENTRWNVTGIISNAINPMWVVLLTFPLVAVWRALDRRGREPSTPVKMLFGMLATSLAFLVMYLAARHGEALAAPGDIYGYKVSPVWLVGAYGVLTLGELMLSPMGLALVSKVAPRHLRGIMMGGWFVATAIGNKLTQIGQLWDDMPHSSFWLLLSGCALFMAFVLMLLLKPLKKAMPGV
jgi:POT family proton-dependent oligopeptide transporter